MTKPTKPSNPPVVPTAGEESATASTVRAELGLPMLDADLLEALRSEVQALQEDVVAAKTAYTVTTNRRAFEGHFRSIENRTNVLTGLIESITHE